MKPGEVSRRASVTISAEQVGADLEGARGFAASQHCGLSADARWLTCHLPPLLAAGDHRVATAELGPAATAATIGPGRVAAGDRAIVESPSGVQIAGGPSVESFADPTLGPAEYVATSWRLPVASDKLAVRLATIRAKAWVVEAYELPAATRRWRMGSAELGGDASGVAVSPDGETVVVSLRQASGDKVAYELIALAGADGSTRWRVPLAVSPLGNPSPLLFAPDGRELAILARDDARCQSCKRIAIVSTSDGTVAREVAVPADAMAGDGTYLVETSAGFTGEAVWLYRYVAPHRTSEMAPLGSTPVEAKCFYEVHDVRAGAKTPLRTLAEARGEWAELSEGCAVRALVPLADGGVAAIRVGSATEVSVVTFDAPP